MPLLSFLECVSTAAAFPESAHANTSGLIHLPPAPTARLSAYLTLSLTSPNVLCFLCFTCATL